MISRRGNRPAGERQAHLRSHLKWPGPRALRVALFLLLTVAVFYLLTRKVSYRDVARTLSQADPLYLLVAASFTFCFPTFAAFRWRRMLLALGYDIPWRDCFNLIMAAWPMGTITPSKSGDLIKAWYLKDRAPAVPVLGSILTERVVDVLVLLALSLIGSAAFGRRSLALISGGALGAGLLGIFVLLRFRLPLPRRLAAKVEPALGSLRLLSCSPGLLAWVLCFTVLNWSASILQTVFAYRALGVHVPVLFAAGALPIAIFIGLLPITLSGMGTRDRAIIVLFASVASADVSLGVGILYSLFGYWLPALVGLPFLRQALPRASRGEVAGQEQLVL